MPTSNIDFLLKTPYYLFNYMARFRVRPHRIIFSFPFSNYSPDILKFVRFRSSPFRLFFKLSISGRKNAFPNRYPGVIFELFLCIVNLITTPKIDFCNTSPYFSAPLTLDS